ncbi:XRE family transcriptional regulator [Aminobacter aminovorans]|uniref:helix-turn-helix domain-containing protein n=1 Tax=Aminobacter aminovorans TaxID=83263 RepID=UPI002857E721|nr:XRE family transcriptional regulator [Aminobacter aminovorans]MDR7222384.1 transcriptional regulator with XRE-family HTH domain [Aminobacter aminovorans]
MTHQPRLSECLRAMRQRHGLKLQEVSERTGLALSTLSKVENDLMSLTYDKILQICTGLDIPVTELLNFEPAKGVERTRRSVVSGTNTLQLATRNYDYSYLCTDLVNKRMVPIIARIHARTLDEFGPLVRHVGEEFAYVLDGEIEIHTDHYAPTRLAAGDGVYIDSTMGHGYVSVGTGEATILCICSAPESGLEQVLIDQA